MADFRATVGINPKWHVTSAPFSNFEFVDTRFGSNPILRRILSLARKHRYAGMLEEEISEASCPLLAAENVGLATRLPDFQRSRVTRLSFFRSADRNQPGEFLGYAVIKQDIHAPESFTHVYEAVLRPPREQQQNNFCHCHQDYLVNTALGKFNTRGVLYAQQNDATFVCAHVAVRTLLASIFPARNISYSDINGWAGVDHADPARQVGSRGRDPALEVRGLNPSQIETILRAAGLQPELFVHEPTQGVPLPADVEFQRLLYGYLESGMPLLLGFELAPDPKTGKASRHIIPVLGHTFNEDLWVPEAERSYFSHDRGYFPSESWLSSYIVHDDNFGPYVCLPRNYLIRDQFRLVIGLKPYSSPNTADLAEALALDFAIFLAAGLANTGLPWLERQLAFTRAQLLVLRPLLIGKQQYLDHLRTLRDRENFDLESAAVTMFEARLPDTFWMTELSAPELFPGSRRKFGEVLITTGNGGSPAQPVLACRTPGLLIFSNATGFDTSRTRLAGHTDLFHLS